MENHVSSSVFVLLLCLLVFVCISEGILCLCVVVECVSGGFVCLCGLLVCIFVGIFVSLKVFSVSVMLLSVYVWSFCVYL